MRAAPVKTFPAELADEAIYILRETAAQFERPAILFSGGKDSIVVTHLAVRAFAPAPVPFPLLHVDTGHNFVETLAYRDRMVDALGLELNVRYVQDSIDKRTRHGGARQVCEPQRAADGDTARRHRGTPARRLHRRREARRGEGARQGAHLLGARRVRPVGRAAPAARAVRHAERPDRAGAERPRLPDLELDRTGRVALHPRGGTRRCRRSTSRTSATCSIATACSGPIRRSSTRRPTNSRIARTVRFRTVGDMTCTAAVVVARGHARRGHRRDRHVGDLRARRPHRRQAIRGCDGTAQAGRVLLVRYGWTCSPTCADAPVPWTMARAR